MPVAGQGYFSVADPLALGSPANEWNTGTWNFTITGTVSAGYALTGGFTLGNLVQLQSNFNPSASISIGASLGTTSGQIPPQMQEYPEVIYTYPMVTNLVDSYGLAGFNGTDPEAYAEFAQGDAAAAWSAPIAIGAPPDHQPSN